MAAQLRALPKLNERPHVSDFSDPGTAMMELPGRLWVTVTNGVGAPGALSRSGAMGLVFCAMLEIIAIIASGEAASNGIGRRLRVLQGALADAPAGGIEAFMRLAHDPDPELRDLLALINRYRVVMPPGHVVVVAHGTNHPQLNLLAWVMSALVGMRVSTRWRGVGSGVVRCIGWRRWPEMKGALYREAFQLDIEALDDACLASVLAQLREEQTIGAALSSITMPAPINCPLGVE